MNQEENILNALIRIEQQLAEQNHQLEIANLIAMYQISLEQGEEQNQWRSPIFTSDGKNNLRATIFDELSLDPKKGRSRGKQ